MITIMKKVKFNINDIRDNFNKNNKNNFNSNDKKDNHLNNKDNITATNHNDNNIIIIQGQANSRRKT